MREMAQARHALTASVLWQDGPRSGGRLRVIATVHDAPAVQVLLAHRVRSGASPAYRNVDGDGSPRASLSWRGHAHALR
jgi:hypothetical protein